MKNIAVFGAGGHAKVVIDVLKVMGGWSVKGLLDENEELKEKNFKNRSKRAAEMLRDDMEAQGPVRLKEVEAAQKDILTVARRLADEGQINLGASGGDEMV